LETATADRYSLHDAAQKAEEVRSKSPDVFARIKSVEVDSFVVVKVPVSDVYDEWMGRIHRRLNRMLRKRASR